MLAFKLQVSNNKQIHRKTQIHGEGWWKYRHLPIVNLRIWMIVSQQLWLMKIHIWIDHYLPLLIILYLLYFMIIIIRSNNIRDPAVRLGSFGFKKVKKNLKAVRVVSVPLRFGSSRFKKRFGSMSAIRVLPESNSNLAISFQSILCWNYFWGKGRVLSLWKQSRTKSFWLWHYFSGQVWLCLCSGGCLAGYLAWLAVDVSFWVMPIWAILCRNICFWNYFLGQGRVQSLWE